jgi:hypothetical protein
MDLQQESFVGHGLCGVLQFTVTSSLIGLYSVPHALYLGLSLRGCRLRPRSISHIGPVICFSVYLASPPRFIRYDV